jgi:hypothetical protein
MTIGAYLQKWTKVIVITRWICVGVAVVIAFVHVDDPKPVMYAWIVAPMIPAIGVVVLYAKRLQCPICNAQLRDSIRDLGVPPALRHCPKCNADFSQQMPGTVCTDRPSHRHCRG